MLSSLCLVPPGHEVGQESEEPSQVAKGKDSRALRIWIPSEGLFQGTGNTTVTKSQTGQWRWVCMDQCFQEPKLRKGFGLPELIETSYLCYVMIESHWKASLNLSWIR